MLSIRRKANRKLAGRGIFPLKGAASPTSPLLQFQPLLSTFISADGGDGGAPEPAGMTPGCLTGSYQAPLPTQQTPPIPTCLCSSLPAPLPLQTTLIPSNTIPDTRAAAPPMQPPSKPIQCHQGGLLCSSQPLEKVWIGFPEPKHNLCQVSLLSPP